jgi:hypothetical protein
MTQHDDWLINLARGAQRVLGYVLLTLVAGVVLAMLFSTEARGQTPAPVKFIKCLPSDVFPGKGEGTPYVFHETAKVEGRVGWCRTDEAAPAGQQFWRPVPYQWCVKTKCLTNPTNLSPFAVLDALRAGPDPIAAASAAVGTLRIKPVVGSAEEADVHIWWARACRMLITAPYPNAPPNGFAPGWVFPANYCPAEPAPPPALSPYVVTAGLPRPAYAVVAGKRATTPTGTAVPGQPCDCVALQVLEFNVFRYCTSPSITGITGPAVTSCSVRKP